MLHNDKSRFDGSHNYPTAQNHGISEEGMCLVQVPDGVGGAAVRASQGVAGEVFAGASILDVSLPTRITKSKTVTVGATAQTLSLGSFTSGSARVTAADGSADTTHVTVATDGTVSVVAATDATNPIAVGTVFNILYSGAPTIAELNIALGDIDRVSALDAGAEVGCMLQGMANTSCFDTTAAWAINDIPKTGPNGLFVKGGSGGDCTGVRVTSLPRAGQPYLGLEIHIR